MPFANPDHFKAIFREAAIGILVTDADFTIKLSNKYAQHLFGYQADELLNQNISILIPNHLKTKHHGHLEKLNHTPIQRPMGVGLDLKAKRKDESLFPIEISLSHFTDNEKLHYVAFVSDVTLKRKVEMELILKNQEINQLNESLEEEVKARTQALQNTLATLEIQTHELEASLQKEKELGDLKIRFVSMASHEFRTPLTSILTSATLIDKYCKEEDQPKRHVHSQRIKSSVSHLTEILEEFLSAGKLENGDIDVHPETFNLFDFLHDIVDELAGSMKDNQTIIVNHLPVETEFTTDPSMFRKVLLNALSNALKFSKNDVFLSIDTNESHTRFVIRDQGIGISESDQKHLFERFFRGSNANNIPGTGLGLHLIDRYLRLIGGNISIQSELGTSTTLQISLPHGH